MIKHNLTALIYMIEKTHVVSKTYIEQYILCSCITLFCTFPNRRRPTATWNFLISRAHFIEQVNTTYKLSFPFCKLRSCSFGFNTWNNVANIWQIKWNGIKSMKFETVRIHFLSKVFGLLSSRNFATMATWLSFFILFF